MKCNIIGAGRVGKNIALSLVQKQIISSVSICNRSMESAQQACQDLGFGQASENIEELPAAEINWICCNDDAISNIVETLVDNPFLKPGTFVFHCSGVLNSQVLEPLKNHGCFIASFHPLKAFKSNYLDAFAFAQVDCVLEGDDKACNWLKDAFTLLDANLISIAPESKVLYHAAACMASNYLITLAACSEELFLKAGISPQKSRQMMVNLMQGNLNNLMQNANIADSLTGPLARGDIKTIGLHLNAIKDAESIQFYQAAALKTLDLTQLPSGIKEEIILRLKDSCLNC